MKLLNRSLCAGAMAMLALSASAQYTFAEQPTTKGLYVGISTGMNWSRLNYSDIDKALYPENKNNFSGMFSIFAQYNFGEHGNFGVRPELAFLTRGGRLPEIGKGILEEYDYRFDPEYDYIGLEDFRYKLKATYFDIRVPLIYTLGKNDWMFRPYVYVAPILGFAHKGYVDVQQSYTNGTYAGVHQDLTKGNYNSVYFAGAIGLGGNVYFNVNGNRCFFGVEANYQHGFTDTYSKKEKDGDLDRIIQIFPDRNIKAKGSRHLSGWELKATIGIPVSIFTSKAKTVVVEEVYEEAVYEAPVQVEKLVSDYEVKPCYSLKEINEMLDAGQSIEGKRICAIEDVQFDINKAVIKKKSYGYLDELAQLIKRTGCKVNVMGHTDNTGTVERNNVLSRERAEAVVNYLISKGVPADRLTSASFGSSRPRMTNDTEAGRRANRRVEFDLE